MQRTILKALLLTVVLMSVIGCDYLPFGYTKIKDIQTNPTSFEGKEIRIRGKVTDIMKIPFVEIKLYTINDGTGDLVVTTTADVPALNEKVTIRGKLDNMAIVQGQSVGVHLKEIKRL